MSSIQIIWITELRHPSSLEAKRYLERRKIASSEKLKWTVTVQDIFSAILYLETWIIFGTFLYSANKQYVIYPSSQLECLSDPALSKG